NGIACPALPYQILSEIQPRVREEGGAGHAVAIAENRVTSLALDRAIFPDERPESIHRFNRPMMQIAIASEVPPGFASRYFHEVGQGRGGNTLSRRHPERHRITHRPHIIGLIS